MTTNNSILVSCVRSNKSDNMVWAVYAQGNEQQTCYCKSPYAAMKMAFRKLKEAAMSPEQVAAKEHVDELVEEFVEEHSVDNVLAKADEEKAKAKGKRKSSKSKASAKKQKEEVAA